VTYVEPKYGENQASSQCRIVICADNRESPKNDVVKTTRQISRIAVRKFGHLIFV